MINTRYTTPTDNMIGSVTKSGEEGQYAVSYTHLTLPTKA